MVMLDRVFRPFLFVQEHKCHRRIVVQVDERVACTCRLPLIGYEVHTILGDGHRLFVFDSHEYADDSVLAKQCKGIAIVRILFGEEFECLFLDALHLFDAIHLRIWGDLVDRD